jgi:hypothetical protein
MGKPLPGLIPGARITIEGVYVPNPEPKTVTVPVTIEKVEHFEDRTVITLDEDSARRVREAMDE